MKGYWQKEVPTKTGQYWTATRDGELAGIQTVAYSVGDNILLWAGHRISNPGIDGWKGFWWSEPIEEPSLPPKWDK